MKKQKKRKKSANPLPQIGRWIASGLLWFLALGCLGSAFWVMLVAAGILLMPVDAVQDLLEYLIPKHWLRVLLVVVLVLLSLFCLPPSEPEGGEAPLPTATAEPTAAPEPTPSATPAPTPTASPAPAPTAAPVSAELTVRFLDVGQADAALIECDGHYMLIDGGNKEDSSLVYTVLKESGVERLDLLVGTHAHEDHVGGLAGALNCAAAERILCPVTEYDSEAFADFKKYAEQNGPGITVPSVGDRYPLGSAEVTVLGLNAGESVNDTSIVLKIQHGEVSFLFTGDAEREAEQVLLASGADLSATVLKVGHHGSDSSTTYPFLREVMPQYAVLSVGEGNTYGHPTEDTLSRLRDADVKVYRTDLQGEIRCTSDGREVVFEAERNGAIDTLVNPTPAPAPTPTTTPEPAAEAAELEYVLNTNTKKFHEPDCKSVNKMKESNKQYYTGTREEIIGMGYTPCGNCNP